MNEVKYSVYVISKGRPQKQTTRLQFNSIGLEHFIVVEKEDYESYKRELPGDYLVLPESDKGVAYARNFCLKDAIRRKDDVCIIADDDIELLYAPKRIINGAVKRDRLPITRDHIDCFVNWFYNTPLTSSTVSVEQFSFRVPHDITLHALQCTFVLYRMTDVLKGNLFFDEEITLVEDVDLTLKMLSHGRLIASVNKICMRMPTPGSQKGGLEKDYKTPHLRDEMFIKVHMKYPNETRLRYASCGELRITIDRDYFKRKFNFVSNNSFNREYPFVMEER